MARAVGIGRTSLYIRPTIQSSKDNQLVRELKAAHERHPLYGVRRLALHLGWSQNKTRRIRRLSGVTAAKPHKKYRSCAGKPEINAPANHLHTYALFKNNSRPQDGMDYSAMTQEANAWSQDFTYLRIRSGMFYLALVMDLTTREILSWKLGTNHSSSLTHVALIQALRNNSSPSILHSDRGSEYLSERHQSTCDRFEIALSASKPGSPWQNGFMERCVKSIKEELGPLSQYHDIDELYVGVANATAYYNNERIHTSLKTTPAAYAAGLKRLDKVFVKKGA
ncbi:MAG: IS3 family transposase [Candidatus Saccharimonadales bacterium]